MSKIRKYAVYHYLDDDKMIGIGREVVASLNQRGNIITLTHFDCIRLHEFLGEMLIDQKSIEEYSAEMNSIITEGRELLQQKQEEVAKAMAKKLIVMSKHFTRAETK